MALRYIGQAKTNENGVAVVPYIGNGYGELDLVAGAVVDGSSIVSTPYEVIDATFYDKGILNDSQTNDNWDTKQATIDRQSTYTELTGSTTVFQVKNISDGVIIEFDYYCTSASENGISVRQGSSSVWQWTLTQLGVSANTWCNIKWKLANGEFWIWVDGVDKTPTTHTISAFNKFYFRVTNDYNIRYKEFKVYPI